jgi:hypothetical protein
MTIIVEVDKDLFTCDEDEMQWLENEILIGNGSLILFSNDIGDSVGIIKSVKNITYEM